MLLDRLFIDICLPNNNYLHIYWVPGTGLKCTSNNGTMRQAYSHNSNNCNISSQGLQSIYYGPFLSPVSQKWHYWLLTFFLSKIILSVVESNAHSRVTPVFPAFLTVITNNVSRYCQLCPKREPLCPFCTLSVNSVMLHNNLQGRLSSDDGAYQRVMLIMFETQTAKVLRRLRTRK